LAERGSDVRARRPREARLLMTRALRWLALATVLAAASASSAAAQERGLLDPPSLVGLPVTTQVVAVDGRPVTEGGLLDLVQTRPGAPLTVADVRETIAHFAGLGRFEGGVVQAHEEPGGVRLAYDLVPVRLIRRLEFRGRVELSGRLLRSRVADRLGEVFSRARLDEMVRALETVYQDHGYMEARILPRPDL